MSSSTSQVPATIAVPGWIWLWYNLICSRDWVESTQSETLESALRSVVSEEMLWREMRFQSFYAIIHLPGML